MGGQHTNFDDPTRGRCINEKSTGVLFKNSLISVSGWKFVANIFALGLVLMGLAFFLFLWRVVQILS